MAKQITIGGYTFEWRLLGEDSASLVLLDGTESTEADGNVVEEYLSEDGQDTWPTDEQVSEAVGLPVEFRDGGDHPDHPESIYAVDLSEVASSQPEAALDLLRAVCDPPERRSDVLPGLDLSRYLANVPTATIEAWVAAGWVEDRGHHVLTRLGWRVL